MLAALLLLSIIIVFHEFGHFLFARLNGVTVVEFSVGMGPRILSHVSKKSGTRYSLKLLPIGGMCQMLGGDEESEESEHEKNEETGEEEWPEDSFLAKSPLARLSIIAAGPLFNFIMAFVFAFIIIMAVGYDDPVLGGISEGYAAEEAGLEVGDRILSLGNRKVRITRDVLTYLTVFPEAEDVDVTYERLNEETGEWEKHETVLLPRYNEEEGRYLFGFLLNQARTPVDGVIEGLRYSCYEVKYWIVSVIDSLRLMITGKASTDNIAGPVRIVSIIDNTVKETKEFGFMTVLLNLLNISVLFSANLGVLNLIPMPPLDGGHILFILLEMISGKPVSMKVRGFIQMIGIVAMMLLLGFVLINDLRFIL